MSVCETYQNPWYKSDFDTVHAHICSFCIWTPKPFLTHEVFLFSLRNTTAMFPKIFCNLMSHFLFSLPKTTRNTIRNISIVLEKLKFVTSSLIIIAQNSRVLIWGENSLQKKVRLDVSCVLWGKRKGRRKRPSFQNVNMIHSITTGSQTQIQQFKKWKDQLCRSWKLSSIKVQAKYYPILL